MKIDEAIEILENVRQRIHLYTSSEHTDALKLGIEALKRVKFGRNHPSGWELEPLTGETKGRATVDK